MAEVYFEGDNGVLCFRHAVQAAMRGESVSAHADDPPGDMHDSCYGFHICKECTKREDEFEDEDNRVYEG
ncbi:hypothetical protein LCGC14_1732050 [marine sediment metagenome]|uniref:Uncharacterized protein n=1 Tax=marine sediment metagenome TaxID=412755 RepID=A0A0F9H912_9ZZZZ